MADILFMTDSAADIPQEQADALGIRVIPFPILFGEREVLDGVTFTRQQFYEELARFPDIPTHAQITPFQFEEFYEQALNEGRDAVICTCINFKGSATGNNAIAARKSFYESHPGADQKMPIHVLDGKTYTYAYGYAVAEGARRAAAGASPEEVLAFMQDWLDHVTIRFATYDLKYARRSGRVSAASAIVGSALGICPIMGFPNGDSKVYAKVRGVKAVIPAIVKYLENEADRDAPYIVINAGLPDRNREILDAAKAVMGRDPVQVMYIGGVIAVNVGSTVVGVIYRSKE